MSSQEHEKRPLKKPTIQDSASIQKPTTLKQKSNVESSILNSSMSTQEHEKHPLKKPTILSMKEKPFDDNQDKDDVDDFQGKNEGQNEERP
jgi:hypothetical protein